MTEGDFHFHLNDGWEVVKRCTTSPTLLHRPIDDVLGDRIPCQYCNQPLNWITQSDNDDLYPKFTLVTVRPYVLTEEP